MRSPRGRGTGLSRAVVILTVALAAAALGSLPVAAEVDPLDQVLPDTTIPAVPSLVLHPRSAVVGKGQSADIQAYLCKTIPAWLRGEMVEPDTLAFIRFPEGDDGVPGTADDLCQETDVDEWKVKGKKVAKLKSGPMGSARATGKKDGATLITAKRFTGSAPGEVLNGVMSLTVVDKLKRNYFTGAASSLGEGEELHVGPGSQFTVTNKACHGETRKCLNWELAEVGFDADSLMNLLAANRGTAAIEVDPVRAAGTALLTEVLRLLSDLDRPAIFSVRIDPEITIPDPDTAEATAPAKPHKVGDFDGDGKVDKLDARYIYWDFGPYGPKPGELDLNDDGLVDIWDFIFIQDLIRADDNGPFGPEDAAEGANAAEREDMEIPEEETDESSEGDQIQDIEELPGLESDEAFVLEGAYGEDITFPPELRDAAIDYGFHLRVEDELTRIATEAGTRDPGINEAARFDAAQELSGQLDGASSRDRFRLAATFATINRPYEDPVLGPSPPGGFYHPDLDADFDGDVDFDDVAQFASSMDPVPDEADLEQLVSETERFQDLYYTTPEEADFAVDEDLELTDEDLELPGLEPDEEEE